MEKDHELPRYTPVDEFAGSRSRRRLKRRVFRLVALLTLTYVIYQHWISPGQSESHQLLSIERLEKDYALCSKLRSVPKDPSSFRQHNARNPSPKPVLIRNATVWTGEPFTGTSVEDAREGKGYSWIQSDVFLENGLIKSVKPGISQSELPENYTVYEANGRLLTAGIVDMHSHTGVDSIPGLRGNEDVNELSSDITPYVRSIDGLNPFDHQIQVIKSGGVTTSLILPGSGNNMGGEAFVIKHAVGPKDGRPEISAEDMLADPEKTWRYMKMACGENAKRVYGRLGRDFGPFSRLGEAWYFRHAFEQASALVKSQDDWCNAANDIGPNKMSSYLPMDLQWESLGAVLRGQVMVNTHCYTVPDLEAFVHHTNEFNFSVRAFHHAHQTYLVPEILKRAYGGRPPAAALFADNMYYKAESYIASERAGKILYDNGITPVYVSDNPVLNAQHVLFEAARAYQYGLPYHVALAGVTSASAELLGLGNRIGKVKAGFDGDVVVWDSDPLSVGATPVQVWIDGTPQFEQPVELIKAPGKPIVPDFHLQKEVKEVDPKKNVIFTGISTLLSLEHSSLLAKQNSIVVEDGKITCIGDCKSKIATLECNDFETVHLNNGHLTPTLTAFGTGLGLVEIQGEEDTQDGANNGNSYSRAVDGLLLDTKQLKAAYRRGITRAITAPLFDDGQKGVSVGFRTGAMHALESGAVWQEETAVHYTLSLSAKQDKTPSLSSAVDELRTKLLKAAKHESNQDDKESNIEEEQLRQVVSGGKSLVIKVHSADIIASLLSVKAVVERASNHSLSLVILGGAESHLLAKELAAAKVGVVLAPLQAYSETWDQRRSLPGAPLTNGTAVDILYAAGVTVALGTTEDSDTRNLGLMAGIVHANSNGLINKTEALDMVSTNIYKMLGLKSKTADSTTEFIIYDGNPLEIGSRVRAVADGRGQVSLWM
ncbi:Hypothetical protein R9X50_00109500 [Acrodontium crateriforme]|uniref:Amidohydrolase-related domain-containing protein n=1 Tax=Acrodontium crateriforme TaxID=150365 RepID=A0AAQ3LZ51_9PEZI|nr:Hypothetical protein R9X50_00109500 [Acrodontium crateriforme]